MNVKFSHLQIYVSDEKISFPFYRDLFEYLGFKKIYSDEVTLGLGNGEMTLWINKTQEKYAKNKYHRKNTGLNHLAFSVESKKDVDRFYKDFLKARNIPTLYATPKLFPEYSDKYYAVFFEDPDRIKLEVVTM